METEIEALRRQREYYTRRLNVNCQLTPAQSEAAVAYIKSTRDMDDEAARSELARHRFVWDGMTTVTAEALRWKNGLLDSIEATGTQLPNPCHECYQKTPEAKADKTKSIPGANASKMFKTKEVNVPKDD